MLPVSVIVERVLGLLKRREWPPGDSRAASQSWRRGGCQRFELKRAVFSQRDRKEANSGEI